MSCFSVGFVVVDLALTPRQVIESTGRVQYVDFNVVDQMSKGEKGLVEVLLFKPEPGMYDENGSLSDESLEELYVKYRLKPIDPYSLGALNKERPAFAMQYPHGTHWKDREGKWCHHAFVDFGGECRVHMNQSERGWKKHWYFAGIRLV